MRNGHALGVTAVDSCIGLTVVPERHALVGKVLESDETPGYGTDMCNDSRDSRQGSLQGDRKVEENSVAENCSNSNSGSSRQVLSVATDSLIPHPTNLEIYGEEPLDENLCASIENIGIDTPLEVTRDYRIIKGHRRWKCAKHLGMPSVPVVIRDDLTNDNAVLFHLIEDNRHQRTRSILQKQREAQHLMEIVKARRCEQGDTHVQWLARLGRLDMTALGDMDQETLERLDAQIAEAKSEIKNPEHAQKTYYLVLKMLGIPAGTYNTARKVNERIDILKREGKDDLVDEITELARNKSLRAAERKAIEHTDRGIRPNKTKVRTVTISAQCDNAMHSLKSLVSLLPNQQDPRAMIAITQVKKIQEEYAALKNRRKRDLPESITPTKERE